MIIGSRYKKQKDNVIEIFEEYENNRERINDGVDIKLLKKKVDALKNGKYTLAVAGEVKAGKSTFINALLGTELLPSDVLQTTSAIVEIYKSEKSFLRVKYGDGHTEEIHDEISTPNIDEAKQKLQEVCKINDDYRDIPTTLIDEYILKSKDKLPLNDELMISIKSNSDLDLESKTSLVKKYINNRDKSKIPIEIQFGYPLKWKFDELRIVDSPGVNALGSIQNISFKYFEDANAILFIHPIKPVESKSFKEFVNNVISERSKNSLFLVLTHAGLLTDAEVNKLHSEAKRLYKNIISENKILVVDSLLQIILNDLENGKTIDEIRNSDKKKKILASYKDQATEENRDIKDILKDSSRFDLMYKSIDDFSMKAPKLQLKEILDKIEDGYSEQKNSLEEKKQLLAKKKRNLQEFEEEIGKRSRDLLKYGNTIYKVEEEFRVKYSFAKNSDWKTSIEMLRIQREEAIKSSTDFNSLRKSLKDTEDIFFDVLESFSKEIKNELSKFLDESNRLFNIRHQIHLPKIDLDSVMEQTKESSIIEERKSHTYYERRIWTLGLWKHEVTYYTDEKVYNESKHLENSKNELLTKLTTQVSNILDESKVLLDNFLKIFKDEIENRIADARDNLNVLLVEKKTNDQIVAEIDELDRQLISIPAILERVKELIQDVEC